MMKRKFLAAMALAVSISAVPLTAYASATVSDSSSVNTESQVKSEGQEAPVAAGKETSATPSVTPEATSVPETTPAPEVSETPEDTPAPSPTETPEKPEIKAGWNSEEKEGTVFWFYFNEETQKPETGIFKADGKTYLADENGYLLTGVQEYTDSDGKAHTYYFSAEGTQPGKDSTYGTQVTGFAADGRYYEPDLAADKFVEADGAVYYADKDGMIVKNSLIRKDNAVYYAGENGELTKNRFETVDGKTYYFDDNGAMYQQKGWLQLDKTYYYIQEDGSRAESQWIKDGIDWYYMNADGTMKADEFTEVDGDLYYFRSWGGMQYNNWYQDPATKEYYYLRSWGGALNNGWNHIDGDWYYFDADCTMKANEFVKLDGDWYYFRSWGGMQYNNWYQDPGTKEYYYLRSWGGALNNGWSYIDGDWYWFDKDCTMAYSQWLKDGNNWYYVRSWGGRLHSQWFKDGIDWYYFHEDGRMAHDEWVQDGIDWYYMRSWGGMMYNQWLTLEGKTYYFRSWGGRCYGGTFVIDGQSYTFDANGCKTEAGWVYINGYRRYRNADGSLSNDVTAIFNPSSKFITVDRIRGITTIYGYNSATGKYDTPIKSMWCSVGNPISNSAAGTYHMGWQVPTKKMVGEGNSYVCWASYVSQIYGAVYFHGVASSTSDLNTIARSDFEALGRPMSHGCIRLAACDAKWIYQNTGTGTTIQIGDNLGCPMSSPVRYQWRGGAYGPDPTYTPL